MIVTPEPPVFDGAVQEIVANPSPAVARIPVGAPGAVAEPVGVTEFDAADKADVPIAFDAATRNVYAVPAVRPDKVAVAVAAPETVVVTPPGVEVTV